MVRTKKKPILKPINTTLLSTSSSTNTSPQNSPTEASATSQISGPSQFSSTRSRANELIRRRYKYDENTIVPLLAGRSTHLPGNTWYQDWIEWMKNNHILLGICLHHPLHPLGWEKRFVALIGSIAFGLSSTTVMYLWDVYDPERMRETLFYVPFMDGNFVVTKGMLLLWSLGGAAHSAFDLMVWYIMACSCCHPGGCCYRDKSKSNMGNMDESSVNSASLDLSRKSTSNDGASIKPKSRRQKFQNIGFYFVLPIIFGLVAIMTLSVLIRASIERRDIGNDDGLNNDDLNDDNTEDTSWSYPWRHVNMEGLNVESFSFLSEYIILLVLSWFAYYPIGVTVFFTGILGCNGSIPGLGGRPHDKAQVEKKLLRGDQPSEIEII